MLTCQNPQGSARVCVCVRARHRLTFPPKLRHPPAGLAGMDTEPENEWKTHGPSSWQRGGKVHLCFVSTHDASTEQKNSPKYTQKPIPACAKIYGIW